MLYCFWMLEILTEEGGDTHWRIQWVEGPHRAHIAEYCMGATKCSCGKTSHQDKDLRI